MSDVYRKARRRQRLSDTKSINHKRKNIAATWGAQLNYYSYGLKAARYVVEYDKAKVIPAHYEERPRYKWNPEACNRSLLTGEIISYGRYELVLEYDYIPEHTYRPVKRRYFQQIKTPYTKTFNFGACKKQARQQTNRKIRHLPVKYCLEPIEDSVWGFSVYAQDYTSSDDVMISSRRSAYRKMHDYARHV